MVFVIFKCTNCGKVTYNECRNREAITSKTYKCYRCGKTSRYKKMKVYRIEDSVLKAQMKARKINLNELEELKLEEKKAYEAIGREYQANETKKSQSKRANCKLESQSEKILKTLYLLKNNSIVIDDEVLRLKLIEQNIPEKQISKIINHLEMEGTLLLKNNKYYEVKL